tara:strand:+ start:1886 stop:2464 length:579 start_codon:yes stop_codon:yes gene_type:complete
MTSLTAPPLLDIRAILKRKKQRYSFKIHVRDEGKFNLSGPFTSAEKQTELNDFFRKKFVNINQSEDFNFQLLRILISEDSKLFTLEFTSNLKEINKNGNILKRIFDFKFILESSSKCRYRNKCSSPNACYPHEQYIKPINSVSNNSISPYFRSNAKSTSPTQNGYGFSSTHKLLLPPIAHIDPKKNERQISQ